MSIAFPMPHASDQFAPVILVDEHATARRTLLILGGLMIGALGLVFALVMVVAAGLFVAFGQGTPATISTASVSASTSPSQPAATTPSLPAPSSTDEAREAPPSPPPPKVLTTEEVVAQCEGSVAFIKGRMGSGTGFLVQDKLLVTNKHVIASEPIEALKIHFPSAAAERRGPFSATLVYEDDALDLAILRVETDLNPLTVASDYEFRRGQEIIVIGNPGVKADLVLQNAISKGVMSTQTTIKGLPYYQLGISINPGNSGGPVFDAQGQVIGVVTLKASEKEGLGFCIPLDQLRKTLEKSQRQTSQEIEVAQSNHRVRVAFLYATVMGEAYKKGMGAYTLAMQTALEKNLNVNVGLEAVKENVKSMLTLKDPTLLEELKSEVAKISKDKNLSDAVRQKFVELWTNYLEFKSYVDNPRGSFESYRSKFTDLADTRERLSESLVLLLGLAAD